MHTANCVAVYTSVGTTARRILRRRRATATAVTRCSTAATIISGAILLTLRLPA
jgi:hypothetical protein